MTLLLSFLLVPLLGACEGLQVDIQYHYQYEGHIATWVHDVPEQYSGATLNANVVLQVTNTNDILVKISNVEVGNRNERGECKPQENPEFSYQDLSATDAALLEQPFLIHANMSTKYYIMVPQEPVWVTNIRRSIVNTIPVYILTGQHPSQLTFMLTEDSVTGHCINWYSLLRLPGHRAELENQKQDEIIEVDVQRERVARLKTSKGKKTTSSSSPKTKRPSKTKVSPAAPYRVPTIADTLSVLTRTRNEESCKESHFVMKINENQESVERAQRSSVGVFLLRGEGTVLRLERTEITGDIIVHTGDSEEEFIRTSLKQVLQLRAVTQINQQDVLSITYAARQRSLNFEMEEETHRSTIQEKLLGISLTDDEAQEAMAGIKEDFLALKNIHEAPVEERQDFLQYYQRWVEVMTIFTKNEIEDLITQVPETESEREILYQALLDSGTDEALMYVLEKLRDRLFRESHSFLTFQFFEVPSTPIRSPALIPAMLEVVSNMGEGEEVAKVLSLLKIAKLVNQLCLSSQTEDTCQSACNTDFILDTFLPTLHQGLQDPLKWKRLITMQAVCALGTPLSVPFLEPIIQGRHNEDIDLRMSAIYCLKADLLPKTATGVVLDLLVPMLNNPTEFPEIRSMAFLVLTTWNLELSWWEHVAISTWKESSPQLVSFISSTLTSLKNVGSDPRSKNAIKVAHLAKHPHHDEPSLSRSEYHYLYEEVKNCQVGSSINLAWISSTESFFPRGVFYQLQYVTVMGMTRREKAIYFTSRIQKYFRNEYPGISSVKEDEGWMIFQEVYEELKEELDLAATKFSPEKYYDVLAILDPLPLLYACYTTESGYCHSDETITRVLQMILAHKTPLHLNLADSTLVLASDLGLPIVIKHKEDFAFSVGEGFSPNLLENFFTIGLSLNINHRNTLKVDTLVPWTHASTAGAGVKASLDINLPLNITGNIHNKRITFRLLGNEEVKLVSMSRLKYTSLMPLHYFTQPIARQGTRGYWQTVWKKQPHQESRRVTLADSLGISLQSEWTGEFAKPGDFITFLSNTSSLRLQYTNFIYQLRLDLSTSHTKSVTFTVSYEMKEVEEESEQDFGQVSQEADEYEFFSQMSQQTSSAEFEDIGQITGAVMVPGLEQDAAPEPEIFTAHLGKMQAQMIPAMGGNVYTLTVTMEPENSPQKYEVAIIMTSSRGDVGEKSATKMHFTYLSAPVERGSSETILACLDFRLDTPYILPLLSKEVLLETSLASTYHITGFVGDLCRGPAAFKMEGSFDVSSTALESITSSQEQNNCSGDPLQSLHSQLSYDQALLTISWAQDYWVLSNVIRNVVAEELQLSATDTIVNEELQPNNRISIEAKVNLESEEWTMKVGGPRRTSVYTIAADPIPLPFTNLFVFNVLDANFRKCHITQQEVNTYDGLQYQFEPSACWSTATITPLSPGHPYYSKQLQFSVQVRFTDLWEVHVIWPISGLVLDLTRSDILVNEEQFDGHSDKFEVYRLQDSLIVGTQMFVIYVGDRVEIMVPDIFYGKVKGVCGNYDGEPSNDMMGPTGCLYTDPALYTLAWNTPGRRGCSRFTLLNQKRSLADYREGCNTDVFQPTGISQQHMMNNCTGWEYQEQINAEGLGCQARVPTPACQPGCQPTRMFTRRLMHKCRMMTPSQQQQQQQQQLDNDLCLSQVLPVTYPSSCSHQ